MVMLIEYPTFRIQNSLVEISSHLVERMCHINPLNKYVQQDP